MASNQRVAVVTGSSSGIGHETSLTLARNGFLTYATMRSLHKGENIKSLAEREKLPLKTVQLDVTDDISVKNAIQSITAEVPSPTHLRIVALYLDRKSFLNLDCKGLDNLLISLQVPPLSRNRAAGLPSRGLTP